MELDRRHKLIHDSVEDALRPEPQAWKGVKLAKGDYDKAYSELVALAKSINRLISEEHPELLRQVPPPTAVFGIGESISQGRKRQPRSSPEGGHGEGEMAEC